MPPGGIPAVTVPLPVLVRSGALALVRFPAAILSVAVRVATIVSIDLLQPAVFVADGSRLTRGNHVEPNGADTPLRTWRTGMVPARTGHPLSRGCPPWAGAPPMPPPICDR